MNDFDKRKCVELTNKMLHKDLCRPFREKVDPERDGAPDYLEIVKNPMDLTTVRKKLVAGEYKSISEWSDDVNLIFKNARLYNDEGSLIDLIAQEMEQWFARKVAQIPRNKEEEWMISLRKYSTVLSRLSYHPPSSIALLHNSSIDNQIQNKQQQQQNDKNVVKSENESTLASQQQENTQDDENKAATTTTENNENIEDQKG